ncbi:MAG: inorganic phosphate transporter [Actinobacteria bacterium]|nr:inorganic phosphate transporter [Actinomycetota bacterium]
METVALVAIIVIALGFDYTNGFHDAANAIATAVGTRALQPRTALAMAALLNLAGAFIAEGVAETIGKGIVSAPTGGAGLLLVFAALAGAIAWNLITWWFGLPSSSTHALVGGLVGAGLAASVTVKWRHVIDKVVLPMVYSPLIGLGLGYLVMLVILWAFRNRNAHRVNRGFRRLQVASAASLALGHGLQDAQKTMGVIVLALIVTHHHHGYGVPLWVKLGAAGAISMGTWAGGWRIMRTLGRRVIQLDPARGFAAEATASSVLYTTALWLHAPVSTTHVLTSSIMGVGATKRRSAVRWGVAGNIVVAWVLTFPAAATIAAVVYGIGHLFM